MKKTLIIAAFATAATFTAPSISFADDAFVAGCKEAMAPAKDQGMTDEQIAGFCGCLDGEVGSNDAAKANLAEAAGDPSLWNDDNKAAMAKCSA